MLSKKSTPKSKSTTSKSTKKSTNSESKIIQPLKKEMTNPLGISCSLMDML